MLVFNKYFYKNKKLKLYFGDRVAVLNDFIYQTGGSIPNGTSSEEGRIAAGAASCLVGLSASYQIFS
jgi:hypothetical protein